MNRPLIRWDRDAQEWIVFLEGVSVGAFSTLYEAERWVCGEGDVVLDLDDAEVDAP